MPSKKNKVNPWIEHYYQVFKFIISNGDFNSITSHTNTPKLNVDPIRLASSTLLDLERIKNGPIDGGLSLPLLEIPIFDDIDSDVNECIGSKHKGTFIIGGTITFNKNILTYYSFPVCIVFATTNYTRTSSKNKNINVESCCLDTIKNNKRIIRRIHFDYQPKDHPKNRSHMQIGGEFPNDSSFNDIHYCLEHFVERPRFPYEKIDFVCLFDFMINEFNSPLVNWREDPQWNKLVNTSKDLLADLD